jgi:Ribbon-helix-helix protein, copG family
MRRLTYRRCSITLDLSTIEKCKELANEKGQSVSAMLRFLVAEAFEEATAAKREERAIEDC